MPCPVALGVVACEGCGGADGAVRGTEKIRASMAILWGFVGIGGFAIGRCGGWVYV
jgi:hypothetical protein